MMVVLIGLLAGGILSDELLGYLLEIVKRARRQRVEPIRYRTFQIGGKSDVQEWIVVRIDHHLVPKCLMCWTWSLTLE